jgi:hypothetical protein
MSDFNSFIRQLLKKSLFLLPFCVMNIPDAFAFDVHPSADEKQASIAGNFNALPMSFEQNQGQVESQVRFLSKGAGLSAFFKQNEVDFLLHKQSTGSDTTHKSMVQGKTNPINGVATVDLLRMQLLHSNGSAILSGTNRLPGTVNYFVGSDPAKWQSGVPTFAQLKYASVYPGVDLVYYGSRGRLEFDFELTPGADAKAIQFRFFGSKTLKLDKDGNLVITAANGDISFLKPLIYQPAGSGGRRFVEGSFRISAGNTVHFAVGSYDRAKPLIIDPILNYSTTGLSSSAKAIAVDAAGEAYVAGGAEYGYYTTSTASFQPNPLSKPIGNWSICVTKLNSTGTALLFTTYILGSGNDVAQAVSLDSSGDAFVAGWTTSADFPTTPGVLQTVNNPTTGTGFVAALNSTGTALLYSTYFGGESTVIIGIAMDSSGNAYLTGNTSNTDFPVTNGAYQTVYPTKTQTGANSAFVSKLNSNGTSLLYSTYLGGSKMDTAEGIAVDSLGDAYVVGNTTSLDFPTSSGAFQLTNKAIVGWGTGFVSEMNPSGSGLVYSTYLGGSKTDYVYAVAVDASGNAYVTGSTISADFPVTPGVFQPSLGYVQFPSGTVSPATNSFVTKLNPSGTGLVYSSFLGGNYNGTGGVSEDTGIGIAVDSQGNAFVAGNTSGLDFPTTVGAFETDNLDELYSDDSASFLTKVNPTATSILYSTLLSGTGNQSGEACDCVGGLALDPLGNAYLAGVTQSVDFPTTPGVVQTTFTFGASFVTEFNADEMKMLPTTTVVLASTPSPVEFGQPVTFTATVTPTSGVTPTGTVGFSFEGIEISDATDIGMGPWTTVNLSGAGVGTFTTSSFFSTSVGVSAY